MTSSLPEDYLRWLEPQIRDEQYTAGLEFWDLVSIMYEKEYPLEAALRVPNDDNRLGDGLELRADFAWQKDLPREIKQELGPCSFLEVLIGLSRRLAFNAGGEANGWAWHLISNIELNKMSDPLSKYKVRKLDNILNKVIWRKYTPDGVGGFFPLAWPDDDQTVKELWYQMAAYIDELHPES